MAIIQGIQRMDLKRFGMLARFVQILLLGILAYGLATSHMIFWILIAMVIPLVMLIIHHSIKPIFVPEFDQRKIAKVKLATFILQNALIIAFYYLMPEKYFSLLCLWAFRINVIEVMIHMFQCKEYALLVPSLALLVGSQPHFVKDPVIILSLTQADPFFIVEYTLWFLAWAAVCLPNRFMVSVHTIYPLFFNPLAWFSVRTLTGMVTLTYTYLPYFYNKIMNTEENLPEIKAFARVYKQLYLLVWVGLYVYRFIS